MTNSCITPIVYQGRHSQVSDQADAQGAFQENRALRHVTEVSLQMTPCGWRSSWKWFHFLFLGAGGENSDYKVIGLPGFKVAEKVILQAGWRYMDVNYRNSPPQLFVLDADMSGAIMGVTWTLKYRNASCL